MFEPIILAISYLTVYAILAAIALPFVIYGVPRLITALCEVIANMKGMRKNETGTNHSK